MSDYYNTLGIAKNASLEEIKKSYRKLSLQHHPDRSNDPASKETFQKINEAYECLSDSEKKKQYDLSRSSSFHNNGKNGPSFNMHGGFPNNEMFNMFFNNMQKDGNPFMNNDFGFGPNVRIFQNGRPVHVNRRPPDIQQTYKIGLQQAYEGCQLPVNIERFRIENDTKTQETETIYIPLQQGVDKNEIMVIKEKGNIVNNIHSDVRIIIDIENHKDFKRDGLNLKMNKKITLRESLCGFTFNLQFLNGNSYTINNKEGNIITPGFTREIPNLGMKRNGQTGKLLVYFEIEFPNQLSIEKINKLKEILD